MLDIRMLRGRGFTPSERSAASGVVVVSEETAHQLWPAGEALGQVLRINVDSQVIHVPDPAAYAASLVVIAAACLLAALVPALRAARIDPIATLREE